MSDWFPPPVLPKWETISTAWTSTPRLWRTLESGKVHIYEPGLEDLVKRNTEQGRLNFTTDLGVGLAESDVVFITVGTPCSEDGSCDLCYVDSVAREVGQKMASPKIVVDKSTVPVGTADRVRAHHQ